MSAVPPAWLTPDWPAPAGVRALSTLRRGGASAPPYSGFNLAGHVGDAPEHVADNRRVLAEVAQLPAEPLWLDQVHGCEVRDLDAADSLAAADAAVTRTRHRVCVILTADCLPVLFASASGDRVGAAHAGWRGLAAGVLEATLQALDCPPADLLAWLGPAIGPAHFEVGAEVRDAFLAADAGAAAAFVAAPRGAPTSGGSQRWLADLYLLARRRLAAAGVRRVYGGGACTYAEGHRYFSHRRDGRTGRQATLIWLENLPDR